MATIQGIYIALFGRPADPIGLAFFNEATNNGADLTAIGDLAGTAEYQSRFEGMNSAQIVTAIYQSLFGRNPELAGLQFFVAQLESGAQNINTIAINILDGAQNEDAAVVANKIAAAEAWTAAVAADPDALAAYQGQAGIDAGVAFLAGITDDEATIPAEAQLDASLALLIAGQPPAETPGQTFTLTPAAGENVVGTDGNDTFLAVVDPGTPANGTLNVGDQINGMGGTDTLNLTVAGGNGALPAGVGIQNVEIVNLNLTTAHVTGLNSAQFAGVQQLWQINTSGAGTFQNVTIGEDVTAGFRGNNAAVGSAVTVANGVDTANVALDGVLGGSTVVFLETTAGDLETVNVSGSVAANGALVLTAVGTEETLNLSITSNSAVTIASFVGAETIDASGSTGNLTLDASALGANLETFMGGSGNDTLTFDGALFAQDEVSIDAGAGNDTIDFDLDNSGAATAVSLAGGAGENIFDFSSTAANDGNIVSVATNATVNASLVSITDFNPAEDAIDITGLAGAGRIAQNVVNAAVNAADPEDLLEAADAAFGAGAAAVDLVVFNFNGNAYIGIDTDASGTFSNNDILIEVQGISAADLTAANFIF
jgi:hypothetical protein